MASFLQRTPPWIELALVHAASFDFIAAGRLGDGGDGGGGDPNNGVDGGGYDDDSDARLLDSQAEPEPQTENTIPSGLLPSQDEEACVGDGDGKDAPSRRGKIAQVIRRGGDFDYYDGDCGNEGDDSDRRFPPHLIVHDGVHSVVAFLSQRTLENLGGGIGGSGGGGFGNGGGGGGIRRIPPNKCLVSINQFTITTILQVCSGNTSLQSQLLKKLYENTPLIPDDELAKQMRRQLNPQLFLCLYLQTSLTTIGAENQGLIGDPSDVHCSASLRRALMEHQRQHGGGPPDNVAEEGDSHCLMTRRLEACHCCYQMKASIGEKRGQRGWDDYGKLQLWQESQVESSQEPSPESVMSSPMPPPIPVQRKKQYGRWNNNQKIIVGDDLEVNSVIPPEWPWESRLTKPDVEATPTAADDGRAVAMPGSVDFLIKQEDVEDELGSNYEEMLLGSAEEGIREAGLSERGLGPSETQQELFDNKEDDGGRDFLDGQLLATGGGNGDSESDDHYAGGAGKISDDGHNREETQMNDEVDNKSDQGEAVAADCRINTPTPQHQEQQQQKPQHQQQELHKQQWQQQQQQLVGNVVELFNNFPEVEDNFDDGVEIMGSEDDDGNNHNGNGDDGDAIVDDENGDDGDDNGDDDDLTVPLPPGADCPFGGSRANSPAGNSDDDIETVVVSLVVDATPADAVRDGRAGEGFMHQPLAAKDEAKAVGLSDSNKENREAKRQGEGGPCSCSSTTAVNVTAEFVGINDMIVDEDEEEEDGNEIEIDENSKGGAQTSVEDDGGGNDNDDEEEEDRNANEEDENSEGGGQSQEDNGGSNDEDEELSQLLTQPLSKPASAMAMDNKNALRDGEKELNDRNDVPSTLASQPPLVSAAAGTANWEDADNGEEKTEGGNRRGGRESQIPMILKRRKQVQNDEAHKPVTQRRKDQLWCSGRDSQIPMLLKQSPQAQDHTVHEAGEGRRESQIPIMPRHKEHGHASQFLPLAETVELKKQPRRRRRRKQRHWQDQEKDDYGHMSQVPIFLRKVPPEMMGQLNNNIREEDGAQIPISIENSGEESETGRRESQIPLSIATSPRGAFTLARGAKGSKSKEGAGEDQDLGPEIQFSPPRGRTKRKILQSPSPLSKKRECLTHQSTPLRGGRHGADGSSDDDWARAYKIGSPTSRPAVRTGSKTSPLLKSQMAGEGSEESGATAPLPAEGPDADVGSARPRPPEPQLLGGDCNNFNDGTAPPPQVEEEEETEQRQQRQEKEVPVPAPAAVDLHVARRVRFSLQRDHIHDDYDYDDDMPGKASNRASLQRDHFRDDGGGTLPAHTHDGMPMDPDVARATNAQGGTSGLAGMPGSPAAMLGNVGAMPSDESHRRPRRRRRRWRRPPSSSDEELSGGDDPEDDDPVVGERRSKKRRKQIRKEDGMDSEDEEERVDLVRILQRMERLADLDWTMGNCSC